ncbi:glycosyl hydrolase family 71-domain-containing protein [Schizophyllum amplum]|uniref:Glycosyl hydrolase family 71-domain-containing protein n=1 Tax=Schizophyllum amplum TaxID=97359 RepID=A0A550CVX7_9AGAR|nr:glycosyl hydrolase family 71-domain-containing protein [Auriculariopsis ampla]
MSSSPKHVFAQFASILSSISWCNTYPYTAREWEQDLVDCAERAALDGFVLNVGREEWQRDRVRDCFATALAMRSTLKFFLSFDMSSIPAATSADMHEAWLVVKRRLEEYAPVIFMPAFFIDPGMIPEREIEMPALDSDKHHLRHLGGWAYMAAVSPCRPTTHYGPDSWNKNWIYRGDDWLYVRRWEQIMSMRAQVDIVQVISRTTYIAPVSGAQPKSQAWVDGFPHDPWMALTAYFAHAFRDGCAPPILQGRIFPWARPHPRDASAEKAVPRPLNWELTDDKFWVVVLATAPAQVALSTGVDEEVHLSGHDDTPDRGKSSRSFASRLKETFTVSRATEIGRTARI